jgi:hypothetical protein
MQAMPRPAPRRAPATTAILSFNVCIFCPFLLSCLKAPPGMAAFDAEAAAKAALPLNLEKT